MILVHIIAGSLLLYQFFIQKDMEFLCSIYMKFVEHIQGVLPWTEKIYKIVWMTPAHNIFPNDIHIYFLFSMDNIDILWIVSILMTHFIARYLVLGVEPTTKFLLNFLFMNAHLYIKYFYIQMLALWTRLVKSCPIEVLKLIPSICLDSISIFVLSIAGSTNVKNFIKCSL